MNQVSQKLKLLSEDTSMVIHHENGMLRIVKFDKCIVYQEVVLTAVSAITCRRMNMLVIVGTRQVHRIAQVV